MSSALFRIVVAAALGVAELAHGQPPNVIVILADDQGYGDVAIQPHNAFVNSPNLDQLARRGIFFTTAYASSSMCTPSRAGLLTGRCPGRLGMYDVSDALIGFPKGQKLMPAYFKDLGYTTGLIGKWHLGGEVADYNHPLNKGFDRFWGFMDSTHDYWRADTGSSLIYGHEAYSPIYDQRTPVAKIDYLTRDITRETLKFIEENKTKPFFLYVAYNAPHVPLQAPKDVYDKYADTGYGEKAKLTRAMQEIEDEGIGQILAALQDFHLTDKTIVIYSSDNGGGEPDGQLNWKLRGGKFVFWEGGIRVPTIISFPGVLPEGKVFTSPIMNTDFLPTVLALTGGKPEANVEGTDLVPWLTGQKSAPVHDTLHWSMPDATKDFAIRSGDWKLVSTGGGFGLYNLAADPFELSDVSKANPEIVKKLWHDNLAWAKANIPSEATPEARQAAQAKKDPAKAKGSYQYGPSFGPSQP